MARRSDHSKEEIREMALRAAESIAGQAGLHGISARKVATEIGYTVGTLYLLFKNLDDLILHVNARTLDSLFEQMRQATQQCDSPEHCLMALARSYVLFATQHPKRWNMVFEHSLPDGEAVPQWLSQKVNSMFELVESQLEPLLKDKMVNNSSIELTQISRTLWCGVHGICALAVTGKLVIGGADSIHVLTDSLINNYLRGLRAQETT